MVKPGPMQVNLPPDLASLVRERIASGRYSTAEDVLRAALALMDADLSGDDAATIRQKIEQGWKEAEGGKLTDSPTP